MTGRWWVEDVTLGHVAISRFFLFFRSGFKVKRFRADARVTLRQAQGMLLLRQK